MKSRLSLAPIRKILASFLSGATTTGVIAILDGVHVHVDQSWAAVIVLALTTAAGYLVPSAPGEPQPPEA